MITIAQIQAAQNNDLDGIAAVLAEMDDRINRLASQTASSMGTNPARYSDYVNDFRQDAMVTLFEYLPRWEGNSVDDFRAYIYGAMAGALKAKAHAERNPGVDRDAMSVFKAMVDRAEGDVYAAEKMAQTVPPKGKRISADRAQAARLAWQGAVSIDKTTGDDESSSIADTLAVTDETPDVIRPKVGTGAALEALAVLQRYGTDPQVLNALPADADGVDAIEDTLTVPRDAEGRKHVLDACAILRSYVSTATEGEVAEELRNVADERKDERAAKIGMVRAAVDKLVGKQLAVITHSFGIMGALEFGWGDSGDVEGLCALLDMTPANLKSNRDKARRNFTKHYIALAAGSEAEAVALAEAAAANITRGGKR